jgi:hypothetical protein
MAWRVDAADYGAAVMNFSQGMHANKPATQQFPWMEIRFPSSDVAPLTAAGCCMALTVNLFEWYASGKELSDYFKWLQTPGGISKIMNMQTKYLGWSTSFGAEATKTVGAAEAALNAFRRKAENAIYKSLNYTSVSSPTFPSLPNSLASKVTEDFSREGRVFKPIYFASLSGQAHAIGAILDYAQSRFVFFDPNEGVAEFISAASMKTWLKLVQPEYAETYSAFFADTKKR